MSFAKKPLPIKGSKKLEKSPLEQIQIILGNEYTVEQIQNVLNQTTDIQNAIKILKSEREALQNNIKQSIINLKTVEQIQQQLDKKSVRRIGFRQEQRNGKYDININGEDNYRFRITQTNNLQFQYSIS